MKYRVTAVFQTDGQKAKGKWGRPSARQKLDPTMLLSEYMIGNAKGLRAVKWGKTNENVYAEAK